MKLIYGERELVMEFRENQVQVAVVENQEYFSRLLENLYRQSTGGEGKFIFSEGDKILSLEKQAEIIWNPFSIDMNNKKILGKLYHELQTISLEESYDAIGNLNAEIIRYLDAISEKVAYPIRFGMDLNLMDLYKLYGVQLETDGSSTLEKLMDYIKIMSSLCGIHMMIFVNLKDYLSENQIKELYKTAFYYKMNLLLIEAHQRETLPDECTQLIDQEFCVIKY